MKIAKVLNVLAISAFIGLSASSLLAEEIIKVGATPVPHEEILKEAQKILAKKQIKLEIKQFTDYVTPNLSTEDGSLDANFFQHRPYLNSFNKDKGTNIIAIADIHIEPIGVYSKKIKNISELKNGDIVAIPNDPSNEARALKLLAKNGLIEIDSTKDLATPKDITKNPKKLVFKEIDAPQLSRVLPDVSIAVINTNFALEAGLKPNKDALILEEGKNSPYANILAVKKGKENDKNIKALVEVLNSKEIKDFINKKYEGAVIPAF